MTKNTKEYNDNKVYHQERQKQNITTRHKFCIKHTTTTYTPSQALQERSLGTITKQAT
ncbi:16594_t:CDS:1, partial [Dentiscutata heterogama]